MIHCHVQLCVGCRMCEVTCADFHFGAVSPALSRIRVAKLEETGMDMAVACLSCVEKPCLDCPDDALSVGKTGSIRVDEELCGGCRVCVDACPVGAIGFYDEHPLYCDLCDGRPACVDNCPTDALVYESDANVSLESFMQLDGNPSQRRARYVATSAAALRASWKNGRRVDG